MKKLHNKELHDCYCLPGIIRETNIRKVKLVRNVARVEGMRNVARVGGMRNVARVGSVRNESTCWGYE